MDVKEKLVELLNNSFAEQYEKRGLLTAPHTATDLIAHGVTVQEWISVKDRLPEVRVPVLTYGRKGAVGIGFTQPTSVTADGKVYFYARYGDSLPTHWMPLPQPPKGE